MSIMLTEVIKAFNGSKFVAKPSTQFYNDKPNSVVSLYRNNAHLGYIRVESAEVNLYFLRPYCLEDVKSQLSKFKCIQSKVEPPTPSHKELQRVYGIHEVEDAISDVAREDWDI